MNLVNNKSYYIATKDAVIREKVHKKSTALNHLLFGDWIKYLGEEKSGWVKIHCRGCNGWIPKSSVTDQRILEINFVDIGQGDGCHIVTPDDEIVLIDAGIGSNMFRFLTWRYNLRRRKVAGAEDEHEFTSSTSARPPIEIDHVVISHPDKDHYYGFKALFESRKVKIKNIYHNGIVERPIKKEDRETDLRYYSGDDLGGYVKATNKKYYLWDIISRNTQMHTIIKKHKTTAKNYLSTLREAVANNADVKFTALSIDDGYLGDFNSTNALSLKVLGPVTESISKGTTSRKALIRLGAEGITKNGHSVILRLEIGKLKMLLGGDLNVEAEDHLLKHYCKTDTEVSKLEKLISKLKDHGHTISNDEKQDLLEAESALEDIITKARRHFQVDIAKACHHGSHHFSETFLKSLNAAAAIISSGDNESYSHPRPDALGSFGKYGRGIRPLVFSTELARSTNEFTEVFKYFSLLKEYEARIENAPTKKEKRKIEKEMQGRRDRNVAVYGMISVRTDGNKVIIAQKLEVAGGNDDKWDIHELKYNDLLGEFVYHKKGGH